MDNTNNRKKPRIINLGGKSKVRAGRLIMSSFCLTGFYRSKKTLDTSKVSLGISGKKDFFSTKFTFRKGIPLPGGFRLNHYRASVPLEDVFACDVQNKVFVYFNDDPGSLYYSFTDAKKGSGRGKHSMLFFKDDLCAFLRQTRKNTVYLTVRETELFDTGEGKKMIDEAYSRAEKEGPSDIILMYEKQCMRYEESASVLFEKLIDIGYENVYYIIDKDNPQIKNLPEKYKSHILEKNSIEHITAFFRCSTFIGTETIGHALQLRASDSRIITKVQDPSLRHVFLQHGVMYMVSLDSEMRAEFRNIDRKLYRIVVSSQNEADHFIKLGGFSPEDMYITGLAKFDRSFRNEGADRIVIMPTWRRWELNMLSENGQSAYIGFIRRIFRAVPEKYRNKVTVLPHPLMKKYIAESDLSDYTNMSDASYDEILRECSLLITDYSSIAYDAFYRGANVIFCWQELCECMEHYGGAHLMIDEETAFGDVCYDTSEITQLAERNYLKGQDPEYIERFSRIVSFHDGRNTERIIECLKKDGLINQ